MVGNPGGTMTEERWTFAGDAPPVGSSTSTAVAVDGTTFCLSAGDGSITADRPEGFFDRDVRVLSHFELLVDGDPPEALASVPLTPFRVALVGRVRAPEHERPTDAGTWLLVRRCRTVVGHRMHEHLQLESHATVPLHVSVELRFAADFASLFDVKAGGADGHRHDGESPAHEPREPHNDGPPRSGLTTDQANAPITGHTGEVGFVRLVAGRDGRALELRARGGIATDRRVHWEAKVPAGGTWQTCIDLQALLPGEPCADDDPCDDPQATAIRSPARWSQWRRSAPRLESGHAGLQRAWQQSVDDLGALQLVDPAGTGGGSVVAAGAPWYMGLFGRDSLITSWMALPLGTELALGVLETLAGLQGRHDDPVTDEQPGRILHEVRFDGPGGAPDVYYGTADATPLFVMLLGEAARWGADPERVAALLPAADRALEWVLGPGDADGDGLVEYQRGAATGLRNQGWKDSWDGVTFADGRVAEPPLALCEVQAYAIAAMRARADLADAYGDPVTAQAWRTRADGRAAMFERAFWIPDQGHYALAIDADGNQVDSVTSNLGHLLWTGVVAPERALRIGRLLVGDDLFSGWGVRTLSTAMAAFDPLSYHNGSVWPHDTAIAVAGLARYGHANAGRRLAAGVIDMAVAHGGRLPELVSGVARSDVPVPVGYPASCSPQAWAAGAPLLVVRSLLGLEPNLPRRQVRLRPRLPDGWEPLAISHLPIGDHRTELTVLGHRALLRGLPTGVHVEVV
jgi:glycogen debranching enzyme